MTLSVFRRTTSLLGDDYCPPNSLAADLRHNSSSPGDDHNDLPKVKISSE
jgi:hypothetical protein